MRTASLSLVITAAVAAAFLLPAAAKADTITETFTLSGSAIDASNFDLAGTSFAQFNPDEGTLTSVETILTGFGSWSSSTSGAYFETNFELEGFGNIGGAQEFHDQDTISIDMTVTNNDSTVLDAFTGTGNAILELGGAFRSSGIATGSFNTDGKLSGEVIYTYTPTAVPEPGSLALLATGLAALGLIGFTGLRRRA